MLYVVQELSVGVPFWRGNTLSQGSQSKAKHPARPGPTPIPRDKGAGMMRSGNLRCLHFIDPWSQKKRVRLFTICMYGLPNLLLGEPLGELDNL